MKYSIDNLIEKFKDHANEFEISEKEHAQKFPDRDKQLDWDFNLPKALQVICQEIKNINKGHE